VPIENGLGGKGKKMSENPSKGEEWRKWGNIQIGGGGRESREKECGGRNP